MAIIDEITVVNGEIIRKIPPKRLDQMITVCNDEIKRLTEEINILTSKKTETEIRKQKLENLKAQLASASIEVI